MIESLRYCTECGKDIGLITHDLKQYKYKIVDKNGIKYFCSWNCYRKAKNKEKSNANSSIN